MGEDEYVLDKDDFAVVMKDLTELLKEKNNIIKSKDECIGTKEKEKDSIESRYHWAFTTIIGIMMAVIFYVLGSYMEARSYAERVAKIEYRLEIEYKFNQDRFSTIDANIKKNTEDILNNRNDINNLGSRLSIKRSGLN